MQQFYSRSDTIYKKNILSQNLNIYFSILEHKDYFLLFSDIANKKPDFY